MSKNFKEIRELIREKVATLSKKEKSALMKEISKNIGCAISSVKQFLAPTGGVNLKIANAFWQHFHNSLITQKITRVVVITYTINDTTEESN